MWTAFFMRFLRRLIREGHLVVNIGGSREIAFGNGDGPKVTVRLKDQSAMRGLMRDPELALGELYTDGSLSIDGGDVQGLLGIARERAQAAGLTDRVTFSLIDYRAMTGQFDRIVSVGMFEHVGAPNVGTFFNLVRDRLAKHGVALIHTIGRTAPPGATNPWIAKYIFPGGYVPSLSEVAEAIQDAGLRIGDIECLRLHYALTLRCWFDRFNAKADLAATLKDERFVRMWRYYLAASEQTFRHGPQDVFQLQLCRRAEAVPITRDYLYTPIAQDLRHAAE